MDNMEDLALRNRRVMSPVRETCPIDYKVWEDGLRGQVFRTNDSFYYIFNTLSPGCDQGIKTVKQTSLSASPCKVKNNSFKQSPVKSDFMTTAATKFVNKSKSRNSFDKDWRKNVDQLVEENIKYVNLINAEKRRHQSEKVNHI
jgi:DNA-binding transcriptional regulator GbsR (MarR family)